MKNKTFYTAIAYWCLALALVLLVSGCKTKKSVIDINQEQKTETEIVDKSTVDKKQSETETENKTETKTETDKSFFEAWMSFESDKITITDKDGKVIEITNPRITKKSSQSNDVSKTEQTDEINNKVATNEEHTQNDIIVKDKTQTKTDVKQTTKTKGREPVYLWIVGGLVVGGLGYFVLKRFKLI